MSTTEHSRVFGAGEIGILRQAFGEAIHKIERGRVLSDSDRDALGRYLIEIAELGSMERTELVARAVRYLTVLNRPGTRAGARHGAVFQPTIRARV